ncbi:MAG: fumarate reductase/succinate dehydrogenase flavoprotein subunit, partial [Nevskia sp.]|nr:fumarate reductase/succinate dehydrogenase flavoprotein subunit [Nevskia sp.]
RMASRKRPVEPYIIPIEERERDAYRRLRVEAGAAH